MAFFNGFALTAALAAALLPATAASDNGWRFSITPYAWLMDVEGTVSALPGQPPVDIDVSYKDVLSDVDAGGMVLMTARHGDWVLRGDLFFSSISTDENLNGILLRRIEVSNKLGFLSGTVGRVIDRGPRHLIEGSVGVRTWWLETDVEVQTALPTPISLSGNASWTDPIVVLSGSYALTENWTLLGSAEVGGFGLGADIEAGFLLAASYAANDWLSLSVGWRNLYVDYDDELEYRVNHTGPLFGATFQF